VDVWLYRSTADVQGHRDSVNKTPVTASELSTDDALKDVLAQYVSISQQAAQFQFQVCPLVPGFSNTLKPIALVPQPVILYSFK